MTTFAPAHVYASFHLTRFDLQIQSGGGSTGLRLDLEPVPKLLSQMRVWCPRAFTVTFKLETDEAILESKVMGSFRAYQQSAVVANLLASHRDRLTVYFADGDRVSAQRQAGEDVIETQLVHVLCGKHREYVAKHAM